jgi:hypothetical protein
MKLTTLFNTSEFAIGYAADRIIETHKVIEICIIEPDRPGRTRLHRFKPLPTVYRPTRAILEQVVALKRLPRQAEQCLLWLWLWLWLGLGPRLGRYDRGSESKDE